MYAFSILFWELAAASAVAQPVRWETSAGGNGHLYEVVLVPGGLTWSAANSAALARGNGWHLATITSTAENAFVFSLINTNPSLWNCCLSGHSNGPWIGGYRSGSGFAWVTSEPFVYSSWGPSEPFGNGDKISFFGYSALIQPYWNDVPDSYPSLPPKGYILENSSVTTIFPLIADGRLIDGTSYTSTLLVYNDETKKTCDLVFRSMATPTVTLRDGTERTGAAITFSLNAYGWEVIRTSGSGILTSPGYAELSCNGNVDSQVLYTFYDPSGLKLAESAVFAQDISSPGSKVQTLIDQRRGERLGIAIANTLDSPATLRLLVVNASGTLIQQTTFNVNARSVTSKFIDELLGGLSANVIGKVIILPLNESSNHQFYVTALSFTGATFVTIPAVKCVSGFGIQCVEIP
jgi:hypothetical protein